MILLTNHTTEVQNVSFGLFAIVVVVIGVLRLIKEVSSNRNVSDLQSKLKTNSYYPVYYKRVSENTPKKTENQDNIKSITAGMTTRQVIGLIGEPAVIDDDWLHPNRIIYIYGKRSRGITLIFEDNSLIDIIDKRR